MKLKIISACALSLLAQACVSIPGAGISSSTDIARDAAALNDAYGRAINDQILLNVLRARDRWPRQYVNLTGIINQPTLSYSAGLTLSPLPFNNAAGPFRGSSLGPLSRSQQSAYNYGIAPPSASDVNGVLLTPIARSVFERYWEETGWPRDILLLVLVKSAQRYVGPTETEHHRVPDDIVLKLMQDEDDPANWDHDLLTNWYTEGDAGDGTTCMESVPARADWWNEDEPLAACSYFSLAHRLAAIAERAAHGDRGQAVHLRDELSPCYDVDKDRGVRVTGANVPLIGALGDTVEHSGGRMRARLRSQDADAAPATTPAHTPARSRTAPTAGDSTPTLVLQSCLSEPNVPVLLELRDQHGVVQATYRLTLRSIDDMIYSLGTLLRTAEPSRQPLPRPLSRVPCTNGVGFCIRAPLFKVREGAGDDPRRFAARVDYQGHRYLAGPAVGDPQQQNEHGDQTASVITLLSQLLTLNVQASTTPPPSRVNTN